MHYRVHIAENANLADSSRLTPHAELHRVGNAVASPRQRVRSHLRRQHGAGMEVEELLHRLVQRRDK